MSSGERFEHSEVPKLGGNTGALVANMLAKSFNEDFYKAAHSHGQSAMFPSNEALLKQLSASPEALPGKDAANHGFGSGSIEPITAQRNPEMAIAMFNNPSETPQGMIVDIARGVTSAVGKTLEELTTVPGFAALDQNFKGLGGILGDLTSVAGGGMFGEGMNFGSILGAMANQELNKQQHQKAEDSLKDPGVQKVTEKHDGPVETVVIEKRDGSVTTLEPDGRKVTVDLEGNKTTDFPPGSTVSQIYESPNGRVITDYADGSTYIIGNLKHDDYSLYFGADGTKVETKLDGTVVTTNPDNSKVTDKPDGTKITQRVDGTEVIEKPNGETVLESRPDKVEKGGIKVWHHDDGTEVRESTDGTRISKFPKSVNEKVKAEIEHTNGDKEQVMRDGTIIQTRADGTVLTIPKV